MNKDWIERLRKCIANDDGRFELTLGNGLIVTVVATKFMQDEGLFCRVFEAPNFKGGHEHALQDEVEYCCVLHEIGQRDPPQYLPNPDFPDGFFDDDP